MVGFRYILSVVSCKTRFAKKIVALVQMKIDWQEQISLEGFIPNWSKDLRTPKSFLPSRSETTTRPTGLGLEKMVFLALAS